MLTTRSLECEHKSAEAKTVKEQLDSQVQAIQETTDKHSGMCTEIDLVENVHH